MTEDHPQDSVRTGYSPAEHLSLASRIAKLGFWVRDPGSNVITFSDEFCDLLEVPRGLVRNRSEVIQQFVVPENREELDRFSALIEGGKDTGHVIVGAVTGSGKHLWLKLYAKRLVLDGKDSIFGVAQDVTDAETLLRERGHLADIVENTPDFVGIGTKDGKVLYINEAFRLLLPAQLRGTLTTTLRITDFHPPKIGQMLLEVAIPEALKHGMWQGRSELLDAHGHAFPVTQIIIAHTDSSGRLERMSTIMRDIRPLLKAEGISQAILQSMQDVLLLVGEDGRTRFVSPSIEPVLGYTPSQFLQHEQDLEDPFQDVYPDDRESLRSTYQRLVATPGSSDHGVIRYRHKDGSWRVFEYSQTNRLQDPALKGMVVVLHDVTDRTREQERFRILFNSAADAMFLMTADKFLECNDATLKLFRCAREAVVDHHPAELSPVTQPDGRSSMEAAKETIQAAFTGAVQRFSWRHQRADGTPFEATVTLNRIELGGAPLLLASVRDETERIEADKRIRESEERFRLAAEQTGQLIYDWDIAKNSQAWDGDTQKLLGYSFDEFRHLSIEQWAEMIHPDDRAHAIALLDETKVSGAPYHAVYRYKRKDGSYIPIEDTGAYLRDDKGVIYRMIGAMKDISVLRESEKILRESESQMRVILDKSLDTIVIISPMGICKYQNAASLPVFGYKPEELVGKNLFSFIHPADLPVVLLQVSKGLFQPGAPLPAKYRFRHKDGSWHSVESMGVNLMNEPAVHGMVIFTRDLTDIQKAQETMVRADELERMNRIMVGRELKMADLKRENDELKLKLAGKSA